MNEEKFTGKADFYDKYRPSYPDSLIDWLYEKTNADTVADVGAGTGKFTACLLKKPWKITAVEPDPDMSEKLSRLKGITVINASAENTGIEQSSIDLVTTAQAFHWFDEELFKKECGRIFRLHGRLAVIFNERNYTGCGISRLRDEICQKYCGAFHSGHVGKRSPEEGDMFLKTEYFSETEYFIAENNIEMDESAFIGDTLSRSYALSEADAGFSDFMRELKSAFEKYEQNGKVTIKYNAKCYLGKF